MYADVPMKTSPADRNPLSLTAHARALELGSRPSAGLVSTSSCNARRSFCPILSSSAPLQNRDTKEGRRPLWCGLPTQHLMSRSLTSANLPDRADNPCKKEQPVPERRTSPSTWISATARSKVLTDSPNSYIHSAVCARTEPQPTTQYDIEAKP